MSLLLDALKRAEEAKRLAAQSGTPTPRDAEPTSETLSLAPKDENQSPLPDLDSHLDAVEQDLRAEASVSRKPAARPTPPAPTGQPAGSAAGGAAQAAARNVFAAKPPAPPPKSRTMLFAGIGGSIAALGIVGYFGYQYMQLTGMLASPTPTAQQTPPRPVTSLAPEDAPAALAESATVPAATSAPRADETMTHIADGRPKPAALQAAAPRPAAGTALREPPAERAAAVRVRAAAPGVDPRLDAAYAALQSGQLAAAEAAYLDVIARDPGNTDARLGLAVIAARAGRYDDAQAQYLLVLEAAPRNAAAHAGLLSIAGAIPAAQRESRLKQLLATPPADPALTGLLHFALGNVYSEQQRWAEAQAAYFDATVADQDNPDYLYNLAVSLEHLQKPALAARQYEAALHAARQRPSTFDREAASGRLKALAP